MRILSIVAVSAAVFLSGCATQPAKYGWGNYEGSLYSYYKDPTKSAEYKAELESTIVSSESTNKPVAPGLYAEYGYLLMQEGKNKEAVAQFEKEKAKWPESTYLMNNMIRVASSATAKTTASKEQ
jgi:hypothetical protein